MVSIDLIGFDIVQDALQQIKNNLNSDSFLEDVGEYMKNSTTMKFKKQKFNMKEKTSDFTLSLRRGKDKSAGKTLIDDGLLLNSINKKVSKNSAKVGSPKIYAKIHDKGGVITAKKNYLYIPANAEIKKQVRSSNVTDTIKHFKSKGYVIFKSYNQLKYYKKNSRQKPETMFYLKKSVQIPKREYLFVSEEDDKVIQSKVIKHLFKGIK